MKNTSTLTELCTTINIYYSDMMLEILRFTRQTAVDDRQLAADPTELGLLPLEGFAQVEIPVADFQETDRFQIVTGLFLSSENTIGPAVDLLALVLREASRDRR